MRLGVQPTQSEERSPIEVVSESSPAISETSPEPEDTVPHQESLGSLLPSALLLLVATIGLLRRLNSLLHRTLKVLSEFMGAPSMEAESARTLLLDLPSRSMGHSELPLSQIVDML
jgi:hypothetical protein